MLPTPEELTEEISRSWRTPERKGQTPVLVLLAGFQGSGKTTLAQRIVDYLGFTLISPDIIRQKLFDRNIHHSKEFTNLVDETRDSLIKRAVLAGISAVCDTNMVPGRVIKIISDLKGQKYKLVTIFLDAPRQVLAKRIEERPQTAGVYRGTTGELEKSITTHGDITKEDYDVVINTEENSPGQALSCAARAIMRAIIGLDKK